MEHGDLIKQRGILAEGDIIGKNYKLQEKLGKGTFTQIWKAINLENNEEVAIKSEDIYVPPQRLFNENNIYSWLHSEFTMTPQAIPQVLHYGLDNANRFMVMDLLGKNLEDLFKMCEEKFTLKTVLMLADQMLERVEYIHSKRIIHRDIKPDSFAIGRGKDKDRVFLLDFAIAKEYASSKGIHIEYKDMMALERSPMFASINAHIGIEPTRRDDLESLGYSFVYFLKGRLPWKKGLKNSEMLNKKMYPGLDVLCKGLPEEFFQYLVHCRSLNFDNDPDYSYLRTMFKNLMKAQEYDYDYQYDWVDIKE